MVDAQNYRLAALEAERRLAEGREAVVKQAQQLATISANSEADVVVDALLQYHVSATQLFNDYDSSIPNAQLFGAHEVEDWRRNQADTCLGLLEFILNHYSVLRTYWEQLGLNMEFPLPSGGAYSQIQSLVRQYYPESASSLRDKFLEAKLPTIGFEVPAKSLASFRVAPDVIEASGFDSRDARDALQRVSSIHVDHARASGALAEEGTARTITALRQEASTKSSPAKLVRDELGKAPVLIGVAVVGGLIVAAVSAWLWPTDGASSVPPPMEQPRPSVIEAPLPTPEGAAD